jgi:ubiquinone/menaquinone biosynthesis C-methylase UbiE
MRRVTAHTVSLVEPALGPGWSLLDVGTGAGYVSAALAARGRRVHGVDIVDARRVQGTGFDLWDGATLPFPDGTFDAVLFGFVLHHIPDARKLDVLTEARRVARRRILVLEDTPATPLDWLAAELHGRRHRRAIGSRADFGFKTRRGWEGWFADMGLRVAASSAIPRLARDWYRPWARGFFVLEP